ncbi:uncharacterized protein BP5553_06379 [Venustampulla echinocandica]|uniref:Heterokaryon incompatibility domain-containing protein n=1 Tax=Venustampulla echinocandica TaxID=2656787 RepID=A0A370TJS2_9HELO|nr:uncharacterized protein BP5553_06379 [Venustampulla echinocandica]RDL35767.1 hypothetical protein BP5553_06379 [Venustampulla echinocandica]
MNHSKLSLNPRLEVICNVCAKFERECNIYLTSRSPENVHKTPDWYFKVHDNFTDLQKCARKGCALCIVLRKALLQGCLSKESLTQLDKCKAPVELSRPTPLNENNTLRWDPRFHIDVKVTEQPRLELVARIFLGRTPNVRQIALNARDKAVFTLAKQWIHRCTEHHHRCTERMEIEHYGNNPARLLDLGIHSSSRVKLVTSPTNRLEPYAALSYCWGKFENNKTTMDSIDEYRNGVDLARFGGTLHDAIVLTRQLEIRYLWIDALCIIQAGDGGKDFARESVRMHKVYGNALVTVSICSSDSSETNFLVARESEGMKTRRCSLLGYKISLPGKTIKQIRAGCPLMSRGWTFQEELLSPRVLYWSNQGIFWACWTEQDSENDPSRKETWRSDPTWKTIVEDYAARDLTKAEDRLTALSGVASRHAQSDLTDRYVAGHWLKSLPPSLLWTVTKPIQQTDCLSTEQYIAPSWSWASIPPGMQIKFPEVYSRTPDPPVRMKVVLHGTDPIGPIKSASITLKNVTRPLLLPGVEQIPWPEAVEDGNKEIYPSLFLSRLTYSVDAVKGTVMVSAGKRQWAIIKIDRMPMPDLQNTVCFRIEKGFLLLKQDHLSSVENSFSRLGCCSHTEWEGFFKVEEAVQSEVILV